MKSISFVIEFKRLLSNSNTFVHNLKNHIRLDILLNNEICKTYFLVIYASKNLLILTLSTWSIWGRGGGTEESCWNVWKARFLVNLIISSSTWAILCLSSIGSFPVDLCKKIPTFGYVTKITSKNNCPNEGINCIQWIQNLLNYLQQKHTTVELLDISSCPLWVEIFLAKLSIVITIPSNVSLSIIQLILPILILLSISFRLLKMVITLW